MDWLPLAGLIVAMTALLYKVLRDQLTDLRADQNRRFDDELLPPDIDRLR